MYILSSDKEKFVPLTRPVYIRSSKVYSDEGYELIHSIYIGNEESNEICLGSYVLKDEALEVLKSITNAVHHRMDIFEMPDEKWISVKRRLPVEGESVRAVIENVGGGMTTYEFDYDTLHTNESDELQWLDGDGKFGRTTIYWTPINNKKL